ncbi:SmtA SAM-dependent methyltransferases [Methylophilaceae bacterium]
MSNSKRDYVDVIYNEINKPLTSYPKQLAFYLFNKYQLQQGDRFLDIGCGRGEFLLGFIACGVRGYGVDSSSAAMKYCPEADFKKVNLENESLPYPNNYFDVVYSKSVIEHFYYPEKLVQEIFRVLKPGGKVITLCPDWEFNIRIYFEDYTHRTPFTKSSLRDIKLIHGFEKVKVERFRQLPILWGSWNLFFFPFSEFTRIFLPSFLRSYFKWVRFSKEIMLLSIAYKPLIGKNKK